MSSAEPFQLQQVLLDRRDAIADSWSKAIAQTSHIPHSASEVRQRLVELTEQAIALLLTEPFDHVGAQAIGASLVRLHYVEPETLGRTQEILAQQLVEDLRAEQVVELQSRLAALLSGLAAGFFQQVRETILAEQEQIRSALTSELRRAQEALREAYDEVEQQVQERTAELRATNESLQREITERKRAEEALRRTHDELEIRVRERTAELAKANQALRTEIAERKRAEEAQQRYAVRLKQRAEELASLNQTSRVVTSLLDVRELLVSIIGLAGQVLNSMYTSVVLVKEDGTLDISAENFQGIPPIEVRARPKGTTRRIIATGEPLVFDEVVDDGTHNPSIVAAGVKSYAGMPLIARGYTLGVLLVHSTEPRAFSGQLPLITTFANQVAIAIINAQLYEQVRAGRERLQALSHRLVEVQETERQRIARELHDEIGQALTGLKLALDMSMHLPADAVRTRLGEVQALVNELMVQVRELSLDLRPAMLDNLGLLPTMLWHFERYTSQTNVRVAFRHTGLEGRRFAPEVETAAYRIVQEALTNVARHADVSEATVRLWAKQDILGLQVEDQGIGFDPEAALATGATSGLAGMRERAILLGGRLTVESATGTGTRLTAEFPLGDHLLERREVER
jgi:signal transduction histidine kinase